MKYQLIVCFMLFLPLTGQVSSEPVYPKVPLLSPDDVKTKSPEDEIQKCLYIFKKWSPNFEFTHTEQVNIDKTMNNPKKLYKILINISRDRAKYYKHQQNKLQNIVNNFMKIHPELTEEEYQQAERKIIGVIALKMAFHQIGNSIGAELDEYIGHKVSKQVEISLKELQRVAKGSGN